MFRYCCAAALGLALALVSSVAGAQSFRTERNWLGPRGDLNAALTERGRLPLAPLPDDGERAWLARLGAVLFRAPDLFGETARRAGLSCDVCHSGGSANRHFFIDGESLKPGTFDIRSTLFNPAVERHPKVIAIPSLGGVARTAPYGHDGRFPALADFLRHIIVEEFGGVAPDALVIDALVAFQERLMAPANPVLDGKGRLLPSAGASARAGETLFARPFASAAGLSCAACHPAATDFTDRQRHDVATGVVVDTPSLRRGGLEPPYFHDGRFDSLAEVVDHFDALYGLGLTAAERADLLAYLMALRGAGETAPVTVTDDAARIAETLWVSEQIMVRRIAAQLGAIVGVARREIGAMHERFLGTDANGVVEAAAARALLVELSVGLRTAEAAAERGEWMAAADLVRRIAARLDAGGAVLTAAAPLSLYNAERRQRFLARQKAN